MKQHYNPVVVLEEEKVTEPEEPEFMDDLLLFDTLEDTLVLKPLGIEPLLGEDEPEPDEQEEPEPRFLTPNAPRYFGFLPSWHKMYHDLKEDNPERAARFLERLVDFGVLGIEPPRTTPEDRLVYCLLDGAMNVIDSKYLKYRSGKAAARRKETAAWRKKVQEAKRKINGY